MPKLKFIPCFQASPKPSPMLFGGTAYFAGIRAEENKLTILS
jgi:hypothetical protein